jgi:hypothetical protein
MSKKLIAPALLAALLVAGCTANANVGANAGTSPAPGSSTAPTGVGASAGVSVGTGTAAGYYKVGRKWAYDITTVTAGTTQKMTQAWECTAINGDEATIKFTMTGGPGGGETTSTSTVKTNSVPSSNGQALPAGTTVTEKGTESVTVAAGTFANAKKFVSTTDDANASTTSDQWVDPEIGLVKMVSLIKPKAAVPGFDLTSTMTMELKSFVK